MPHAGAYNAVVADEMRVLEWCKADGALVKAGDVVCVVGMGDAEMEIDSFDAGILRHLKKVGEVIALPLDPPFRIDPAG